MEELTGADVVDGGVVELRPDHKLVSTCCERQAVVVGGFGMGAVDHQRALTTTGHVPQVDTSNTAGGDGLAVGAERDPAGFAEAGQTTLDTSVEPLSNVMPFGPLTASSEPFGLKARL